MKIGVIELLIVLVVVLVVVLFRRRKKKRVQAIRSPQPSARERRAVSVPASIDGAPMVYHYDDVGIYTPDRLGLDFSCIAPGLPVCFVHEPSNEYDSDAIAACVDHDEFRKIGYMNRGKLRDMLSDWMERLDPIHAHIASVDDSARKITLYIAFYREQ